MKLTLKKDIPFVLALLCLSSGLIGCGGSSAPAADSSDASIAVNQELVDMDERAYREKEAQGAAR